MDKLIPVISKLQDVFATIGSQSQLNLPQIVVVGSQSAGKSSVIEGIVGRDFLPRGTGIVTRRPLLLHLVHVPLESVGLRNIGGLIQKGDWAVFEHKPGMVYASFDMVRQEIERETDRLTGSNKGISSIPISLKIFSHKVVNLSLIDLPGITKVPIGDQPKDIEFQIRKMIVSYIKNPNSLILAVTPANQDFATSEPLKLAREYDEFGDRTLAVLTKLDLMDQGTDALDVLTGKLVPVKLGIIGLVNRSQADIKRNKSIEECLKDEEAFLNEKYPFLASVNGVRYLSKTLNQHLIQHIQRCIPQLKQRIDSMMLQSQLKLNSYGEPVVDRNQTLLQIITQFCSAYISTIEGTSKNINMTELCGGARICHIFYSMFGVALERIDSLHGLAAIEVLTAIRNSTGPRPALFVSEITFELLAKRQIRRLEEPSLACADLVYEELHRIIRCSGFEAEAEMAKRFPLLFEQINKVMTDFLLSRLTPTKEFIANMIGVELAFINSRHPDFIGANVDGDLSERNSNEDHFSEPATTNHCDQMKEPGNSYSEKQVEKLVSKTNALKVDHQLEKKRTKSKGIFWTFRKDNDDISKNNGACKVKQDHNHAPVDCKLNNNDIFGAKSDKAQELERKADIDQLEKQLSITNREKRDCLAIMQLVQSYVSVVRKSIQDMVPKTVMMFLVNHVKDNMQNELVRKLYNSNDIGDLLHESEITAQARKGQQTVLQALAKASAIISEIGDVQVW